MAVNEKRLAVAAAVHEELSAGRNHVTTSDIAKKLGMSTADVYAHLSALERQGLINGGFVAVRRGNRTELRDRDEVSGRQAVGSIAWQSATSEGYAGELAPPRSIEPPMVGRDVRGSAARALSFNRSQALKLAGTLGTDVLEGILTRAQLDLERRLARIGDSTTPLNVADMQATLKQIKSLTQMVATNVGQVVVDNAGAVADEAAGGLLDYLGRAEKQFGVKARPLALREATVLEAAAKGARGAVLRRLSSTPEELQAEEGVPEGEYNPERSDGILGRYTAATIGEFEGILQTGLVTGKPWGDIRAEITGASPFLQGAPAHWAERIVRTETMGAYNRANWEAIRAADDELGDMVKILSATFDDRTGWDSIQIHGQIRMPDEAFEWAGGFFQTPPNRPNDREVVVPHRISWPIPPELGWRSDGEVVAAWARSRRKGAPPGRPLMTTVPLERFGK